MPRPSDAPDYQGEYQDRRNKRLRDGAQQTSVVFNKGDVELIEWLSEYLGTSRASVIRSSVRSFAAHLQAISKDRS